MSMLMFVCVTRTFFLVLYWVLQVVVLNKIDLPVVKEKMSELEESLKRHMQHSR